MNFFQYLGCIEIVQPTRNLTQDRRSEVAKECLRLLTGTGTGRFKDLVGSQSTENSGDVQLHLEPDKFMIKTDDPEEPDLITTHSKDSISFVTLMDDVRPHVFIYCAKDRVGFRACYVLKCLHDQDLNEIKKITNSIFRGHKGSTGSNPNSPTSKEFKENL